MSKKEKDEVQAKEFDSARPEQNRQTQPDPETMSHNWQPNSPAHDVSYPGVSANAVNTVAEAEKAKEEAKEPEFEDISKEEYERRTKLDVSDRDYINPSQDHPAKKKK